MTKISSSLSTVAGCGLIALSIGLGFYSLIAYLVERWGRGLDPYSVSGRRTGPIGLWRDAQGDSANRRMVER
jgi:hypothetical protein